MALLLGCVPENYYAPCASSDDCIRALECLPAAGTEPSDGDMVCTRECETDADCPAALLGCPNVTCAGDGVCGDPAMCR